MKAMIRCILLCMSLVFSCGIGHAEEMHRVRPFSYDLDKIGLELAMPGYYLMYNDKLIRFSAIGNYYDIYTIIEKHPTKCIGLYAITYFADGTVTKGGKEQITIDLQKTNYADLGGTEETLAGILEDKKLEKILLNEPVTATYVEREHIHPDMGINTICGRIKMSKGKPKFLETNTSLRRLLDGKVAYDHYITIDNLVLENARENDRLCITGILYMAVDMDAGESAEATVFFGPLRSTLEGRARLKLTAEQAKEAALVGKEYTYDGSKDEILNAANAGDVERIKRCLRKGANINAKRDIKFYTPLHNAAEHGHLDAVRYLIGQGALLNERTRNGWTPLFMAARNGHLDVVKELVNSGASTKIASYNGVSPKEIALRKGHSAIAEYLVSQGDSPRSPERQADSAEQPAKRGSGSNSLEDIMERTTGF